MGLAPVNATRFKTFRFGFFVSAAVAALPVITSVLAVVAAGSNPGPFSETIGGDLSKPFFWTLQLVFVCVALCGNGMVDLMKAVIIGVQDDALRFDALMRLASLAACLVVACLCYGLSLASAFPGWILASLMALVSALGAVLSWRAVDLLVRIG